MTKHFFLLLSPLSLFLKCKKKLIYYPEYGPFCITRTQPIGRAGALHVHILPPLAVMGKLVHC